MFKSVVVTFVVLLTIAAGVLLFETSCKSPSASNPPDTRYLEAGRLRPGKALTPHKDHNKRIAAAPWTPRPQTNGLRRRGAGST